MVGHVGRQGGEGASARVRPPAAPVLDLLAVAIGRGVARVLVSRPRTPVGPPAAGVAPAAATPAPARAPVGARSRARLQLVRGGPLADG